jgi:hypothetical protein
MATRNIVPRADTEGGIGTALKRWGLGWINALVVNSIKIVTGAGSNKVLTSDADGNASWGAPVSAGFQSGCSAYLNSSQTIGTTSMTKVLLATEDWDTLNEFDPTTNHRFTATAAGIYLVSMKLGWENITATGAYYMTLYLNGVEFRRGEFQGALTGKWLGCLGTLLVKLAADDYLELYAYQNSGSNQSLYPGSAYTFMSIQRVL